MKRAKDSPENSYANSNGLDIYVSKPKSGFTRNSKGHGQFERLDDAVVLTDVSTKDSTLEFDHLGMKTRAHADAKASQPYDGDGIRKNIDVSVTYGVI